MLFNKSMPILVGILSLLLIGCQEEITESQELSITGENFELCVGEREQLQAYVSGSDNAEVVFEIESGPGEVVGSYFQAPETISSATSRATIIARVAGSPEIYGRIYGLINNNPRNSFQRFPSDGFEVSESMELPSGEILSVGSSTNQTIIVWFFNAAGVELHSRSYEQGVEPGCFLDSQNDIWIYFQAGEGSKILKLDVNLSIVETRSLNTRVHAIKVLDIGKLLFAGLAPQTAGEQTDNYQWLSLRDDNFAEIWADATRLGSVDDVAIWNEVVYSTGYGGQDSIFLRMTSLAGEELFYEAMPGQIASIAATGDGVYVADRSPAPRVRKFDLQGSKIWEEEYLTDDIAWTRSIVPGANGGFVIGGDSPRIYFEGSYDHSFLLSGNSDGSVNWQRLYNYGSNSEYIFKVTSSRDGGYILSGKTSGKASLVKTNREGRLVCPCDCDD
jgi:WD40 repeat protein